MFFQTVFDKFGAVIKMLDSGDKIKVDQTHLETVIPAIGLWQWCCEFHVQIVLVDSNYYRNFLVLTTDCQFYRANFKKCSE